MRMKNGIPGPDKQVRGFFFAPLRSLLEYLWKRRGAALRLPCPVSAFFVLESEDTHTLDLGKGDLE